MRETTTYNVYVAGILYVVEARTAVQARQKAKGQHMVKTGYLPVGSRIRVEETP